MVNKVNKSILFNKYLKLSNFYSIIIAFLPILSIYVSPIPGLTIGDLSLVILLFVSFTIPSNALYKRTISRSLLFFCGYLIIALILGLCNINNYPLKDVLIRTIRISFYIIIVSLPSRSMFNYNVAAKWCIRISLFATLYILLQYFSFYVFKFILKGYIPYFKIYLDDYTKLNYEHLYSISMFRPTSFFLEPAHYSQYALVGLILSLWSNHKTLLKPLLISLGIILSTSGQGLVFCIIIWIIYIFSNKKVKYRFLLILSFIIISLFSLNIEVVQKNVDRILDFNNPAGAFAARFEGYYSLSELNIFQILFGCGYGYIDTNYWYTSLSYLLWGVGIIGLSLIIFILIKNINKLKNSANIISFLFLLFFITASIFNSYMFVYYMSFILYYKGKESNINEKNIDNVRNVSTTSVCKRDLYRENY